MTNYIKAMVIVLLINSFQIKLLAMEDQEQIEAPCIFNLPINTLIIIHVEAISDSSIISDADTIHCALDFLPTKISRRLKRFSLICSKYNDLIKCLISQPEFKLLLKNFYRHIFMEQFLELRHNGLFPRNSEWIEDENLNNQIAQFLVMDDKTNDTTLHNLCESKIDDKYFLVGWLNNYEPQLPKLIRLLIFYGANLNARNKYIKDTSLMVACRSKNKTEIVKLLLKYGSNTEEKNDCGHTALMITCGYGYIDTLIILLDYDADVNAKDKFNQTH